MRIILLILAVNMITTAAKVQDGLNWVGYSCNHFGRKLGRDLEWITRPKSLEPHLIPKMITRCTSLMLSAPVSLISLPFHVVFNAIASYVPAQRLRILEENTPAAASRTFTLLSLNGCLHEGLFAPVTGGVVPPLDPAGGHTTRVAAIADYIGQQNPDIFVGQEFHDLRVVSVFIREMKKQGYTTFVWDPSPHAICVNSGLLVASKVKLGNISFIPFYVKDRGGLSKGVRKGAIAFSVLDSQNQPILQILNTHLSDGSEHQWARDIQLKDYLLPKLSTPLPSILVGDFNFDTSLHPTPYPNLFQGIPTCSNRGKISLRGRNIPFETETIDGMIPNTPAITLSDLRSTELFSEGELLSDHFAISAKIDL